MFPSPTFTPSSSTSSSSANLSPPPPPVTALLKHRFPKKYRHPHLDAQLTRQRVTSEARTLVRAARGGVRVPTLRGVDVEAGVVGMEWIDGWSVREVLGGGAESDELAGVEEEEEKEQEEGRTTTEGEEGVNSNPWDSLDLGELPPAYEAGPSLV